MPARAEIWLEISAPLAPPSQLSYMMSTLTVHCQWVDETVRKRTGHPPSYAEAKKMKSLTLHTHGCLRASLRDCSSSSSKLGKPPLNTHIRASVAFLWMQLASNRFLRQILKQRSSQENISTGFIYSRVRSFLRALIRVTHLFHGKVEPMNPLNTKYSHVLKYQVTKPAFFD